MTTLAPTKSELTVKRPPTVGSLPATSAALFIAANVLVITASICRSSIRELNSGLPSFTRRTFSARPPSGLAPLHWSDSPTASPGRCCSCSSVGSPSTPCCLGSKYLAPSVQFPY